MSTIAQDARPIHSAYSAGEELVGATVGFLGVTRIEPYNENGQMARGSLPWLKVWKGDHLAARLNCAHMAEITYAEVSDDGD